MRLLPFTFALIYLFTSCEGNTTRVKKVRNNTAIPFVIHFNSDWTDYQEIEIQPATTETVSLYDVLGGKSDAGEPSAGIYYWYIIQGSDTATKSYLLKENWSIISEQVKRVPSNWRHEYLFEVNESDF